MACDHRDDTAVAALFDRVDDEHGRLDILVNNAFIIPNELTSGRPFWELPLSNWDDMIDVGSRRLRGERVRGAAHGSPRARPHRERQRVGRGGVRVARRVRRGQVRVDRITADTTLELGSHGVTVVSVWPGFVRTERIDIAVDSGVVSDTLDVDSAESPRFTGRAVVALATDADVSRWSGRAVTVRDLADQYGFRDVDGRLPPGPMHHDTPD